MEEQQIVNLKSNNTTSENIVHITHIDEFKGMIGSRYTYSGYVIDSNNLPIGTKFCFDAFKIPIDGLLEDKEYWSASFDLKILYFEEVYNWFERLWAIYERSCGY